MKKDCRDNSIATPERRQSADLSQRCVSGTAAGAICQNNRTMAERRIVSALRSRHDGRSRMRELQQTTYSSLRDVRCTTVAIRQNDRTMAERTTFAARRMERYGRTTADNRIVSARRSRHDDRRRPRQREKRECSTARRRASGAE